MLQSVLQCINQFCALDASWKTVGVSMQVSRTGYMQLEFPFLHETGLGIGRHFSLQCKVSETALLRSREMMALGMWLNFVSRCKT